MNKTNQRNEDTMKKFCITLFVLLAAAGMLSACGTLPGTATAAPTAAVVLPENTYKDASVAEGRLVPVNKLDLAFVSGGRVKEVIAKEGDSVQAGQVLAVLEGEEQYKAQDSAAQVEQVDAGNTLKKLKEDALLNLTKASVAVEDARDDFDHLSGSWNKSNSDKVSAFDTALTDYLESDDDVTDAQRKLDDLGDQATDSPARIQARERLARELTRRQTAYTSLLAEYEKPKEGGVDDKRTRLVEAIAALENARLQVNKLANGIDPDAEALLTARTQNAAASQAAADKAIDDLRLKAPWAGTLSNWDVRAGQVVYSGGIIGALADTSAWMVETTDLSEDDVVNLKPGQAVNMTINALPGQTFTGRVESIHAKGEKIQGDMTYVAHIAVDRIDPQFRWNMTVKILGD
jgi:HlyD family secretion protein